MHDIIIVKSKSEINYIVVNYVVIVNGRQLKYIPLWSVSKYDYQE